MPTTGEIILHTVTGLVSLTILIIMGRYLLWPLFKQQPVLMGIIVVTMIAAMALMFAFGG